jgi:hypothetical protein
LLKEGVDLFPVGSSEVAQELGGQVAVTLGVEGLGRWGEGIEVRRSTPPGAAQRLGALEQPVLLEVDELEADGRWGEAELGGQRVGGQGTLALEQVEDGPAGGRQRIERGPHGGRL